MPASTDSRSDAGGGVATVVGEQGRGLAQLHHLGAAVLALGEVLLEPGALEVVERVHGVGARELVQIRS